MSGGVGWKVNKTIKKKSSAGWEEWMFSRATKTKMNFALKQYFYSLSSNQKLHNQETTSQSSICYHVQNQ